MIRSETSIGSLAFRYLRRPARLHLTGITTFRELLILLHTTRPIGWPVRRRAHRR